MLSPEPYPPVISTASVKFLAVVEVEVVVVVDVVVIVVFELHVKVILGIPSRFDIHLFKGQKNTFS